MHWLQEACSWFFLLSGSFFCVVGGIGLLRFPDFFTRLHAAGITDTLGAGLIIIGLMVYSGLTLVSAKLLVILGFLYITSPTSTHAVARAALSRGLKPWTKEEDGDDDSTR